jgi:hypothetical protein
MNARFRRTIPLAAGLAVLGFIWLAAVGDRRSEVASERSASSARLRSEDSFEPAPAAGPRIRARLGGKPLVQPDGPHDEAAEPALRAVRFERQSFAALRKFKRGDALAIPLPGGGEAVATVNLVQTEPDGTERMGGSVANSPGGSFFLGSSNKEFGGMILLPESGLAYVIGEDADGTMLLRERPLSEVVCQKMSASEMPPAPGGLPMPIPVPEGSPPILSSRPSATAVLYLDFDGETVTDTAWNHGNTIVADPAQLTNAEISDTWSRVREDFWPFNIDVTTNLQRYANAPVGRRIRVIITPTDAAAPGTGGVAYVNIFSLAGNNPSFSATIPCWVFNQGIVGSAETISHEIGHTLGLVHDGMPGQEYYEGHGSGVVGWAPIMGVGFYRPLVQWSKGEYANASNQEDDVALIASAQNGFGYVADEAGNTIGTAAALAVTGGVVNQSGIITQASDNDYYAFAVTQPSTVTLTADPAGISPNLDILLELQNSSGNILTVANPDLALNAGFSIFVAAGTHYVRIRGTGRGIVTADGYSNYGSIGHYSIRGSIVTNGLPVISSAPTADALTGDFFAYQITASNSPTSYGVVGNLPPGLSLNSSTGLILGTPTGIGQFSVTLRATNAVGFGTSALTLSIVAGRSFSNSTALMIASEGPAMPYPSTIEVNGFSGEPSKVVVKLFGFGHTYPGDVDILLVGPSGQSVMLLSDVGGSDDISDANLVFDDNAASPVGQPIATGTFRPTNLFFNESFALPAPAPPYGDDLTGFNQVNPNGLWKLFVSDRYGGDSGVIAGGWSLSFHTETTAPILTVDPPLRLVDVGPVSSGFAVTANRNWNWSSDANWVLADQPTNYLGSRYFNYTLPANMGAARSAVITLTSGALTTTHTIHQAPAFPDGYANTLVQNLPAGSQSLWRAYGNSLEEAVMTTAAGYQTDAFDTVGQVDVRTRSAFGTVTATNLWGNYGVAPQTGTFNATFSTTPSSNSIDTVLGFSSGVADWWDDLAAYIRFNPQGQIDARNGNTFSAVNVLNYTAGVSYLVEMEVNVVTRRFRAVVTPSGGAPVVIANNYAFLTEQSATTRIANFACLAWTGGTQTVSQLVVPALGTVTASNVWGNHAIAPQRTSLVGTFRTTPGSNAMDAVIGFSSSAADFWDDMAAYVRFNPQGRIDARNGNGFAAATVLNYTAGVSYTVTIEIDLINRHYWAAVTPAGGAAVLIANNYAFNTPQSTVIELSNFGWLAWSGGTQTVAGLVVSEYGALTATNVWGNRGLTPQDGTFHASFTTVPSGGAVDTVIGFSCGLSDFWDDLAACVRFNDQGKIDARNGAVYVADSDMTYTAGVAYLVEMEMNVPLKRFSVTVTPPGGAARVIAYSHAFRNEQLAVTSLSNFGYLTWTGGNQIIRDFAVTATKQELPALSAANTNGPLMATATSGTTRIAKQIHLVPGLHATDEIITVENLAALQRQITIQLTDNYGSDSATVVHATSSGDAIVGPGDHWFVSNDRSDPSVTSSDPTLMVSWVGSPHFSVTDPILVPGGGSDQLRFSLVATLAAGQQASFTVRRQLFGNASEAINLGQPVGSGIADLANLTMSMGSLSPSFSSTLTAYTSQVPNGLPSVSVTPTVSQPGATVKVNGITVTSGAPSATIILSIGVNPITTVVTAPDGLTTKSYTIYVARAPSSNADLADLTLSAGALLPGFVPGTANYTATVANAISSVTVTPTTQSGFAIVTVNGNPAVSGTASEVSGLNVGANPIATVVTAQDGITKKRYTIDLTRTPNALQAWRENWFGTYDSTGMAENLLDPDKDNLVNLLEFGFGLNPMLGSSCQTPQAQRVGGNYVVSFPTPPGVSGVSYGAKWNATLGADGWQTIPDTGSGGSHLFSLPTSGKSRVFIRLSVTEVP